MQSRAQLYLMLVTLVSIVGLGTRVTLVWMPTGCDGVAGSLESGEKEVKGGEMQKMQGKEKEEATKRRNYRQGRVKEQNKEEGMKIKGPSSI